MVLSRPVWPKSIVWLLARVTKSTPPSTSICAFPASPQNWNVALPDRVSCESEHSRLAMVR